MEKLITSGFTVRYPFAFVVLIICTVYSGKGQTNALESDPLRARKIIIFDQVGVYAGASLNSQGGSFTTECNCEFDGGAQNGYVFGFLFERLTKSQLQWGVSASYESRGVEARYQEIEGVVQRAPSTNAEYTVPVTFRHVADVMLNYLSLSPYVKYTFWDLLFVRSGVQASYITNTRVTHTKELLSTTVTFPNGEQASVQLGETNQNSVLVQDSPLPAVNNFQFGLTFAAGFDIKASKKLYFSPVVQFVYPITSITNADGGFSVRALQLIIEARIII